MLKHLPLTPVLTPVFMLLMAGNAYASPPQPAEQIELKRLVIQDCGSCHGLRMTGGLGPALTPEALRDLPRSSLVATVLHGRPGTAMPPWRLILDESEAEWIVDRLLEGIAPQ